MNNEKELAVKEAFDLAIQNHQKNNLQDAQNYYQKVLKIDPNCTPAHNNLGVIYENLQENQKAKDCYEKAIEINPNYLAAHSNLGNIFKEFGENQRAKECYEKVIEINPTHAHALNNLGVIFENLGENQKAKDCYEKAIEINPNYLDALNNLGVIFKNLGKYQKAKDCYEKVIEIDPNYIAALNNLGTMFNVLGNHPKAISCYERVLEIDPNNAEPYNNLGVICYELSEYQKAKDCYERAIKINPNYTDALYNLGVLFFSIKKDKNAAEQFKLINYKNSKSYLLNCLYNMNDKSTFLKVLDELIKQSESNPIIGSLTSRSEIKYGIKKPNLFCEEPLKYTLMTNLTEEYDFENIFVKPIKDILKENTFSFRRQDLLKNSNQTAGNIFDKKNNFLDKIKNIIHLEVKKYQEHFKESTEGVIRNWPKSYSIYAWLVSMKSGGKINPHMHDVGWLSGSFYINVPPKLKADSGNLVLCIDDNEQESQNNLNPKKIMNVTTGSLCLFPSSLYHYTIPFESKEDRIVLAFDVRPD